MKHLASWVSAITFAVTPALADDTSKDDEFENAVGECLLAVSGDKDASMSPTDAASKVLALVAELASDGEALEAVLPLIESDGLTCYREAFGVRDAIFVPSRGRYSSAANSSELEREADEQRRELALENEKKAVRQRICELREVVTKTRTTIRQAEAAQQERRIETLAVTIQECSAWFKDDARGALTNDVCNSIFASGGLPNSEISGPTTSEALLAEEINTYAKTELEILVESGMLLETIAAMAAEMGISETAVSYDCDQ